MFKQLLKRLKKLKTFPDSLRDQEKKNIQTILQLADDVGDEYEKKSIFAKMKKRVKELEKNPNSAGKHNQYN